MKTKNIRKFWLLFNSMPHLDKETEKEELVLSFTNGRTASISEMSLSEFNIMLAMLEGRAAMVQMSNRDAQLDRARKRVMAAIGKWLRTRHYTENNQTIFIIALRSCENKYKKFNDIPLQKLNSIYAAFTNRCTIEQKVDEVCRDFSLQERERLEGLMLEAVDGEEYELAAEYHKKLERR